MPTYDYKCPKCGNEDSVFMTISRYVRESPTLSCHCGVQMERKLSVVPTNALSFALAGDRHYEGLRGPNGEDIGSRTKHREFMKQSGLTTVDDFRGHFKQAEKKRAEYRQGTFKDPDLRQDITRQVMEAVAKPD